MSVRSWDGWRDPRDGWVRPDRRDDTNGYTQRVRTVSWPTDAPDPKDVPQAGERVRNYVAGEGMVDAVVETGIPLRSFMGDRDTWVMTVVTERGRHVVDLSVIRRIPEPTDGEVVQTVEVKDGWLYSAQFKGMPDGEYEIRRVSGKEGA